MMKKLLSVTFFMYFLATTCICFLATNVMAQSVTTTKDSSVASKSLAESKVLVESLNFAHRNALIKNQPYSAEAVSESIKVLADGNRIVKSSSVKMFRDSEGRTRREPVDNGKKHSSFVASGLALPSIYSFRRSITIYDPVASVRYTLNPTKKTAKEYKLRKRISDSDKVYSTEALQAKLKEIEKTKLKNLSKGKHLIELADGKQRYIVIEDLISSSRKNFKVESLGTKMIDGVEVEGKKTVRTIEAGKVGNELPIKITYERWYSKELDLIMYSRKYDPRYGEQIYRLENFDRNELDISLFTVPVDYEIVEAKPARFFRKKDK